MAAREPLRIAMWSGPRNISTAMMRAWGNRPDTIVVDEPLYAHYLKITGHDHPGRAEILARGETDGDRVITRLLAPLPAGVSIFFQKHMAQHLLPHLEHGWLDRLTHCFLIREPREVLLSYIEQRPRVTFEELGLRQQVELFRAAAERTGRTPPVLDARDVLLDPEDMLRRLCAALGVEFTEAMLSWPAGRRTSDGVWGHYWYGAVERSTGFAPYRPRLEPLPASYRELYAECLPYYAELYAARLLPARGMHAAEVR
jgi:hypothetical protein